MGSDENGMLARIGTKHDEPPKHLLGAIERVRRLFACVQVGVTMRGRVP